MNKLIVKDIKKPKDLSNYIFARGRIKIEGEVNLGRDYYDNPLGCEYTDISLFDDILVLEKDKIITDDEVTDYNLHIERSVAVERLKIICDYNKPHMLKYAVPTDDTLRTYNVIKIFCDELFVFNPDQFSKFKTLCLKEVEDE